jgi:CRP-like cAMP-binding protein
MILRQGEDGDTFYIIQSGSVDVLVREDSEPPESLGRAVNKLTEGYNFGK